MKSVGQVVRKGRLEVLGKGVRGGEAAIHRWNFSFIQESSALL